MSKHDNTLVLAHYYTIPEVQEMADHVGDSLELSLVAQREKAKRIVFLGVRFMAETAKILNPDAEVIIPDRNATCSLVEQTDIDSLRAWLGHGRQWYLEKEGKDVVHVSYINSSAQHKAMSDWIVTSRNVDDIIKSLHEQGKVVFFSPDRNMGAYLNYAYGWDMKIWSAVCEVHDKFNDEQLKTEFRKWTDGPKYLLAHPESPLPVLKMAQELGPRGLIGSTFKMLKWIESFPHTVGTIYVATEEGLLYNMRKARPELDIRQAPSYSGCQCNQCPYMKLNTVQNVKLAVLEGKGTTIDYISENVMERARLPIIRMLDFSASHK